MLSHELLLVHYSLYVLLRTYYRSTLPMMLSVYLLMHGLSSCMIAFPKHVLPSTVP